MADVMEVVDLRQAAAFEQMLSSADATVELRDKLLEANGEAARMAKVIGDTLQGSFLKFTSAMQGFSIALMKDFVAGFKRAIDNVTRFTTFLTQNSEAISSAIKAIVKLAKWVGIYKIAVASVVPIQTGLNFLIKSYTASTISARIATFTFAGAIRTLKLAWQSLLGSTGVGLAVVALTEIASAFLLSSDKADDATKSTGDYNKELENTIDLETSLAGIKDGINAIMNKRFAQTVKQGEADKANIEREITLRKSLYFGSLRGSNTLNSAERKAHLDGIKRLEQRLKLEERNIKEIKKKNWEKAQQEKDLITIQETALKNAQEIVTTNEEDLIAKNKLIKSIEKEIARLKELGVEEKKVNKEKEKDNTLAWAKVDVMKEVLAGNKSLEDAERELRDMAIDRAEAELAALPVFIMASDVRLELEQKIIDLKMKNRKETEKGVKSDEKTLKQSVKAYSDLGSALQEVAGDNEKLNGIRKAGEAITKAAAIAESVLNLQKAITVVTEGKLTIAKLLGTKATIANTAAIGAEAVVEGAAIVPAVALGAAKQTKLPFPLNLIAVVATLALLSKIMGMFEKGGIISDGKKFANGGMVHGPSHAQGGVKFAVGGRVNELEGGEAVINKRSTAMFRNQLSEMNAAGGGVKFADGGLLSSPQFTEAQFNANNQSQMLGAMGGQRKVVVVESDITDSQSTVSVIQANATF